MPGMRREDREGAAGKPPFSNRFEDAVGQASARRRWNAKRRQPPLWEPFRLSIEQWAPQCKIVCDKFHIMQHANDAIDEVRKAEVFRQRPKKRVSSKERKWLLHRGRGYKSLRYMLLKAARLAATNVEFISVPSMKKVAVKWHLLTNSRSESHLLTFYSSRSRTGTAPLGRRSPR